MHVQAAPEVSVNAMTHIRQICHDFFIAWFFSLDPFLSHDFLWQKNAACVNGTIEITLEWIQCDIATSKMPWICLMCVMALIESKKTVWINMLGHVNACQDGNILYLDTKCWIQEDTTWTHILVKSQNCNKILYWLLKTCVFTSNH